MGRNKPKFVSALILLILLGQIFFSMADSARADSDAAVTGCAGNLRQEHSEEFKIEDFDVVNVGADKNGLMGLIYKYAAIDPNKIVIPFTQEVSVNFLFEEIDYGLSDFGWMLAHQGINGPKHEVYRNLNDNNGDGVLDLSNDNQRPAFSDVNGDGSNDARDSRKILGTFAEGTELVFYLKVDDENQTYYTKDEWNPDIYQTDNGECSQNEAGTEFTKTYHLGRQLSDEGACTLDSNWMTAAAYERARNLFGIKFDEDHVTILEIKRNMPFAHVISGTPANKPNSWVLGWEALQGGGDTDHNDLIFQIERKTGGMARLRSENALVPKEPGGHFTGVNVALYDRMPCEGITNITYYLSTDNGGNWLEIREWDNVYPFTRSKDGNNILGERIRGWIPGYPEYTYRRTTLDFAGRGLTGNQLIWKAVFTSQAEDCEPAVIGLALEAGVADHGGFSRSAPVVVANVIYSGSYETPAAHWPAKDMRGHLVATQLYDPHNPETAATAAVWDAGEILSQTSPDIRNIKFPAISVHKTAGEIKATGDAATKTFSGKLNDHPLLAGSISVTDQTERFYDNHNGLLEGSLGGTGTINRFTGEFKVTFSDAPDKNQPITASYHYYKARQQLLDFTSANVTFEMLGLDDSEIIPYGKLNDFNGDGTVNAADGQWLINWVRGYKDGSRKPKDWLLGPIDHSVPAVATPPGQPAWLFGTDTSAEERNSFENFRILQARRNTVIYVGARDGMLHAFDAGRFRYGDNQISDVDENRGYFIWEDQSEDCPNYCTEACDECPDYGSGRELWAFIPANLIPKLKNNLRKADDQAYVNASPTLADVFIGGEWKTVLLSAEGNGGDTVFCLDVTDPTDPKYLWEFADPDLFRSRASPSVAQIGRIVDHGKTRWVAFLAARNSASASFYPSIYLIDVADGSVVNRIYLKADPGGLGGVPSGQPTIIDSDGNGYIDRVYIGSDTGRLYKINLPDDPKKTISSINHCRINNDFTDDQLNEIDPDQRWHPINGSPVAIVANSLTQEGDISPNIRIFFGTGDGPYHNEDIDAADTSYHFFAYRDQSEKGQCNQDAVHLDWFLELEAGERIFSSAYAAAGNLYFGTSSAETEIPCAAGDGSQDVLSGGRLYVVSLEGDLITSQEVGNVTATPLVVDKHLYVKSQALGLRSFGGGSYNNPTIMGGDPQMRLRHWREMD